jgi:hypothetical protein
MQFEGELERDFLIMGDKVKMKNDSREGVLIGNDLDEYPSIKYLVKFEDETTILASEQEFENFR